MTLHDATRSSAFWTSVSWLFLLVAGLGAVFALVFVEIPLEALVVLTSAGILMMLLARARTYTVVFTIMLVVMFLNVANYSFLTFSVEGYARSTAAGSYLALIRLPFVAALVLFVFVRQASSFGAFLRRNWDVLLLAGSGFLSVFFAIERFSTFVYTGWFATSLMAALAFVYVLGTSVRREGWSEHLAWLGLLAYAVLIAFALMNLGEYAGYASLAPAFADSNIHAIACAIVLVSLLVLMRQRRIGLASGFLGRLPAPLLVAFGGLAVVPLVLSAKRMPILAVVVAFVVFAVSEQRLGRAFRKKSVISVLLVIATFVTLAWLVLPMAGSTAYRFTRLFETGTADSSVAARLDIIGLGMQIFLRSPAFGIGLNNAAMATRDIVGAGEVAGYGLHNTYIAVVVELGILGALLFTLVCLRSLWLMRPRRIGLLLSTNLLVLGIPAVLYSATEYSLIPGQIAFWPFWLAILLPRIALVPVIRRQASPVAQGRGRDSGHRTSWDAPGRLV